LTQDIVDPRDKRHIRFGCTDTTGATDEEGAVNIEYGRSNGLVQSSAGGVPTGYGGKMMDKVPKTGIMHEKGPISTD
jgi:hypothetical protein